MQLNIGTGPNGSFSIAADAAFNMTLDPPFTPYANNLFFIHGAFIFEDVGVTAYQVRTQPGHPSEHGSTHPSLSCLYPVNGCLLPARLPVSW